MGNQLTDLTGLAIPPDRTSTAQGIDRILSIPPVRDVPNEQAVEFTMSAFSNLAAAGTTFIPLTDPSTGAAFVGQIPQVYRGRFAALLLYCPDMVAAAAPYLTFQLTINGQLANAWGQVPIYPRTGIASLSFEMFTDLPPNAKVQLFARNTDPANTHFLGVYLYGWLWPKDLQQG